MTMSHDPAPDRRREIESAIAIHRTGRIDEAEAVYRRVLGAEPDNAEALHMLGVVHLQRQRLDDAVALFERAIAQNADDARYHNNLGNALMGLGRRERAVAAFRRAVAADPDFLIARCNLGTALYETQNLAEAGREFATVLERDPANLAAITNFGALLLKQNRIAEAEKYFRHGIEHHAENIGLLANLGVALERLNKLEEAGSIAREAAAIDPSAMAPRFLLARLDKRAGRLEPAHDALRSLLAGSLNHDLATDVRFELGQVLDALGRHDDATAAFRDANAAQAETAEARASRPDRFHERVAANRRAFGRDRLPTNPAPSAASPEGRPPVFFVGFPRSGTTLMERALAAHPDIVTTEEDSPLEPLVLRLQDEADYAAAVERLAESDLEAGRRAFWSEVEKAHGPIGQATLVDKMPLNIVDLGYANLLFPDGRAIIALRDPRDACLSCFMQRFRMNDAMRNFVDFATTVRTYAAVMELWMHYREVLTIPWMEYRYEDLIDDVEGTLKSVVAFIGLDWHSDVERYRDHAAGKSINTPSYRDVAKPVYTRAIGRWRSYRGLIDPHLETLEPYISAFGYDTE